MPAAFTVAAKAKSYFILSTAGGEQNVAKKQGNKGLKFVRNILNTVTRGRKHV